MRKLALLALLSLPMMADFFPSTVHTTVASSNAQSIQLQKAFPVNGMSGIVIHKYGNDAEAITGYVVQTNSNGTASYERRETINHKKLPTINTAVTKGDTVTGGYLYNNVMLLAPDDATYARITEKYKKNWIHPDLYSLYLSTNGDNTPTKENLSNFAQEHQVGLVMIVQKDKVILFDPISMQNISQMAFDGTSANAKFPFFSHFDAINTSWFKSSKKVEGNYYKTMESF